MQKTCLVYAVGVNLLQKLKGMKTEEWGLLGCDTVRSDTVHHFQGVCCPHLVSYSTYSSTLRVKAVQYYRKSGSLRTTHCHNPEKHTLNNYCVRFSNQVESKLIMDTNELIQNKPEVQNIYTIQENGTDELKTVASDHEQQLSSLFPTSLKSPSLFSTFPYFYLSPGLCIP